MRNEQHAYRLGRRTSDRCPQRSSDAAGAICGKSALIVPLIQKKQTIAHTLERAEMLPSSNRASALEENQMRPTRVHMLRRRRFKQDLFPKAPFRTDAGAIARSAASRNHQLASGQGPPDTAVRQLRPPPFNSTNQAIDRNRRLAECTARAGGQAASFCGVAMDHLAVRRVDRNSHN
jgi:hypothetical protein